MQYQTKEFEKQYKDLRSRFLGMTIGCAVGEIVVRESLEYRNPEDDEYERRVALVSGLKPESPYRYEPGKNTELLNGSCEAFFGADQTHEFEDCRGNQLFFRVAPIAFISVADNMDVRGTVSMAIKAMKKNHKDPSDFLAPLEGVMLLMSILRKTTAIPTVWEQLADVIADSAQKQHIGMQKSIKSYQSIRNHALEELRPDSPLYMLKFVLQRVLQLEEGDDWEKVPPWKVATDRLIEETKGMDEPARITAGALTGSLLGAYWGVGTINSFYRNRLADLDEYFSRGQWWFDLLGALLEESQPKDHQPKKASRNSDYFEPYLAHGDQPELKAVFYTVVVRNEALKKMYPGGVAAYHQKHSPIANRDICISCYMGGDVNDCVNDLLLCGLMPSDDFVYFDANDGTMFKTAEEIEGKPRDMRADWLRGRYHDGYLWVRYQDVNKYRRRAHG